MATRKDLGSLLIDENVIGAKDLERVERERGGRPLWKALIDAELATEEELFFVLAQGFGVAVLKEETLDKTAMPEPLKRHLSREQARAQGLLPMELAPDGQHVTVAMVDPSDEEALAAFLTRAQIPEGRALLAMQSVIARAIERNFGQRAPSVAGTVEIDPSLAAEIKRLPERQRRSEPLTPLPRTRRRKGPGADDEAAPIELDDLQGATQREEALHAEERFSQALIEAIEALSQELEKRAVTATRPALGAGAQAGELEGVRVGRTGIAVEMARLSRRVARQLGLARRAAEEIGVAAHLYALDRLLRQVEGGPAGEHVRFGELGWPAAGEGGLVPILRTLTAASAGFGRGSPAAPPLGARIIALVASYLELGAASGEADLGTVSQLLRASSAGAPVVDALIRVLEGDRGDSKTASQPTLRSAPKVTTLPATSVLREKTPPAVPAAENDRTVKKAPPTAGSRRREPREE